MRDRIISSSRHHLACTHNGVALVLSNVAAPLLSLLVDCCFSRLQTCCHIFFHRLLYHSSCCQGGCPCLQCCCHHHCITHAVSSCCMLCYFCSWLIVVVWKFSSPVAVVVTVAAWSRPLPCKVNVAPFIMVIRLCCCRRCHCHLHCCQLIVWQQMWWCLASRHWCGQSSIALLLGVVVVAAVATVMLLLVTAIAWNWHHFILPLLDVLPSLRLPSRECCRRFMLPSLRVAIASCCRRFVLPSLHVAVASCCHRLCCHWLVLPSVGIAFAWFTSFFYCSWFVLLLVLLLLVLLSPPPVLLWQVCRALKDLLKDYSFLGLSYLLV